MSSKVKQANFRLPIAYMQFIDEVATRQSLTKAAVITRSLDCLRSTFDSDDWSIESTGVQVPVQPAAAAPVDAAPAASSAELEELKAKLAQMQARAEAAEQAKQAAEARIAEMERMRDTAESKVREMESAVATANAKAAAAAPSAESVASAAADKEEIARLRATVARQEATLEEKAAAYAAKEAELATVNASIAKRDAKIASLSQELGAANAKIDMANTANEVKAVMVNGPDAVDADTERALYMFNMLGGVMGAFQQQVADARKVGEQEGREAVRREIKDMIDKARNEGYRDAMGYLDNRVTNARDTGAKEERARIANMSFFERRRYLRMHVA